MANGLKIGDLAKRTDSAVETIRYYEQQGLLPEPARSQNNYRLYGEHHVERLSFIRHCRALDMTLDEIRNLLKLRDTPEENCEAVNLLLEEHIGHVHRRIEELQTLEAQLHQLRRQCQVSQAARDCGILQSLSSSEGTPVNLGTHKGGCH